MFGSHLFSERIEQLCKHGMDALVIGKGTDGVAKISEDARKFMESKEVTLNELPSESAIQKFNQVMSNGKRVGAIIHVTL